MNPKIQCRFVSCAALCLVIAAPALAQPSRRDRPQQPPAEPVTPTKTEAPMVFPSDQSADCMHIKLDLNVNVPAKSVRGRATIDLSAKRRTPSIRFDAVNMQTASVSLIRAGTQDAGPASFSNDGQSITITCNPPLNPGEQASVVIDYAIDSPQKGLSFFGPKDGDPDAPHLVWSQGESTDNRHWFPCFDHPNERQTSELIVTTAAGNEVISNGKLLEKSEDKDAGTVRFHWKQDKPHAAYLVTLIVGEFAKEEEQWRGRPVRYFAHPKYRERMKRSFGRTLAMLDFFSERIGVEYPWDQYAQTACYGFGGGMENTSATTLGERMLHDERSMLDGDSDGLIAHELAHQWFGDLVTCNEWAHTWLNEGFASYFDPLWMEHDKGADEFAYDMAGNARGAINGGRERPIVYRQYTNADEQFDSRAYPKGSWVLHMLRRKLGDELFFKCVKRYVTDHANKCVETVDLRKSFEAESGLGLEKFFYQWTERPGHPVVTLDHAWIEDDKLYRIRLKQTQKEAAFEFPLSMEFHVADREPIRLTREISDKEDTVYVSLPARPTLVRVDPDNAVLWELTQNKGRDLWESQLTNDANVVARIEAAKWFGKAGADRDARLLAAALEKEKFWGVARSIAEALKDCGGDTARDALLKGAGHAHPRVRRACVDQLASFANDAKVVAALQEIVSKGDASYAVESAAIDGYGRLMPDNAMDTLMPVLERDSRYEVIRTAALGAISRQPVPAALDVMMTWAGADKPRECRAEALSGMARIAANTALSEEKLNKVVDTLAKSLKGESRALQRAAIGGLDQLGGAARRALPALDAVSLTGPRTGRAREGLDRTIRRIRENQPAQAEVGTLRDELQKLKKDNDALRGRVTELEARTKTGRSDSASHDGDSDKPENSDRPRPSGRRRTREGEPRP